MSYKLFTSESVAAGHPDKIADAISDAILDACLKQDRLARTGIEVIVGANRVGLFGEIKTNAKVDFEDVARKTIKSLGYNNEDWNFSYNSPIENNIHQQSPEISVGVDTGGAGDQGMMFGYACDETKELMPLPISIAHSLMRLLDQKRENGQLGFLRPDGKSQVTVKYVNGVAKSIEKVVMAVAHNEAFAHEQISEIVKVEIIDKVLSQYGYDIEKDKVIVNGTGLWHIPGPDTDAGLTGRKIVVDGYGGYARVGGGAFSGKDPSKVDRSGAYAARYIAKNIVAKGYAKKCEIALAYAIGQSNPLMVSFDTFNSHTVRQKIISDLIDKLLDTSVEGIIKGLDLRKPIYSKTTAYGHFGKSELPWEKIAKI